MKMLVLIDLRQFSIAGLESIHAIAGRKNLTHEACAEVILQEAVGAKTTKMQNHEKTETGTLPENTANPA